MNHSRIAPALPGNDILGHPKGLFVLFFTEMWERFSYYGMRSLLVLYMTGYLFAEIELLARGLRQTVRGALAFGG